MTSIFCDFYATLHTPYRFEAAGEWYNSYLATYVRNGSTFAFSIAQAVKDDYSPLLPAGTVSHVVGNLSVVNRTIFVLASSMPGLRALSGMSGETFHEACRPTVTFVGKVTRGYHVDPARPAVVDIEVTVPCKGSWPGRATTVTCYFNRESKRFRALSPISAGESVDISGRLSGWQDGCLAIDVYEARPNFAGELPDAQLIRVPNPFDGVPVSGDYAVFPALGQRRNASTEAAGARVRPFSNSSTRAPVGDENTNPTGPSVDIDLNVHRVPTGVAV